MDGLHGEMNQGKHNGNTTLVDYGILNEISDIRVHVCFAARRCYAYKTEEGRNAINKYKHVILEKSARQGDIITAMGYPMPLDYIDDVREIIIPDVWLSILKPQVKDKEDEKGRKAIRVIIGLLKRGHFPLWIDSKDEEDQALQISGVDILVSCKQKIQVKCDFRGGHKKYGGTGNLYLQTKECNPYKLK